VWFGKVKGVLSIGALVPKTLSDPSLRLRVTGQGVRLLVSTVRLGRITHHLSAAIALPVKANRWPQAMKQTA
jgi:hypothetical protein